MSDTALHYDELARRLGVTIPTARRMVNRFRWRRTRDNHGRALIHVPDEYLARRAEAMETPSRADIRADLETAPETAGRADQRAARKADLEGAQMAALMARLEALERELMDAVHKLGAAEADTTNTRHMVEELRVLLDETHQDRDVWRARAEQLTTAEGRADAAEERAEGLRAVLDVERHRCEEIAARAERVERERSQALERLNVNIDRLERVQIEHHAELTTVRDQLAQAQSDRDRAVEALATHLALPWWRRLFA